MLMFKTPQLSVSKRNVSLVPVLSIAPTEGIVRLNEAASKFLGIKSSEYMAFFNNENVILEALQNKDSEDHTALQEWAEENNTTADKYPLTFWVAKGWGLVDEKGNPIMGVERLSKSDIDNGVVAEEVQRYVGSKMSSQTGATGYGTLSGASIVNWKKLGGSKTGKVAYTINPQGISVDMDGRDVTMYELVFDETADSSDLDNE